MATDSAASLRTVARWGIAIFLILLLVWVASWVAIIALSTQPFSVAEPTRTALERLSNQLVLMGSLAWDFARPLLQLLVVLLIVDLVLSRMGLTGITELASASWNVQTVVALVVVCSFAVAALGGISSGLSELKDLALVVVGFYFGSQRRVLEIETADGKLKQVVEHENPRSTSSS